MKKVLITGGAGFYGSHLVKHILANTDWMVTVIDRVDSAGNMNRLSDLSEWQNDPFRRKFVWHDLRSAINPLLSNQLGNFDYILHVAAASHVDRSIVDPMGFVMDNVVGTGNMLEFARQRVPERFLYFSTDEVFGPTTNGKFKEWDRYHAGSPYAATKACGEELCLAYHNTYNVPVLITHCMNIFGERQHPEKFIPKLIGHLLKNEVVPIHTDAEGKTPTSRGYVYADVVSQAVMPVLS